MMKMKSVYCCVAVISLLLVACVPMRVVPKWSPDVYNGFKVIQGVQKKDTIGHTDPVQRRKDLQSCGVMNFYNGHLDLNKVYQGESLRDVDNRSAKVVGCMKNKGYVFFSTEECTENGVDAGICN